MAAFLLSPRLASPFLLSPRLASPFLLSPRLARFSRWRFFNPSVRTHVRPTVSASPLSSLPSHSASSPPILPNAAVAPNLPSDTASSLLWISRTSYCGELGSEDVGKRVRICGWVALHRIHGGLTFFNLRDSSGIVQVTTLPNEYTEAYATANKLRLEYVVAVEGTVMSRPLESVNKKMKTGDIEVAAEHVIVLNPVNRALPFPVTIADNLKDTITEEIRLRYRFLDLRRAQMQFNLRLRHKVVKLIRRFLEDEHNFVEPGTFYALPQSPQLFKQMLMVFGFEKYYQIARYFVVFVTFHTTGVFRIY